MRKIIAKPAVAIALALALGAFRCSPQPPPVEWPSTCGPKTPPQNCPK